MSFWKHGQPKKNLKTKILYTFGKVSQGSFNTCFLLKYNAVTYHCIQPKQFLPFKNVSLAVHTSKN